MNINATPPLQTFSHCFAYVFILSGTKAKTHAALNPLYSVSTIEMDPRALDELLAPTALSLRAVLGAFADHAPPAQIFEILKDLFVRRRCPTPKGLISAGCHDLRHLLCVLRIFE